MTEGESRRIDALTSAVGELSGLVKGMAQQWAMQENHASAGRAIIHEKIDALTREIGSISGEVRMVTQDVAELKNDVETNIQPAIVAYNIKLARQEGHGEGVAWSAKLFWAMIIGLASAVGFAIHEMLLYFGHYPGIHSFAGVHG